MFRESFKLNNGKTITNYDDGFNSLLFLLIDELKLNKNEKSMCFEEYASKKEDLLQFRENIEEDRKDITPVAYFFILYMLVLKNMEDKLLFDNFKSGKSFYKITSILKNGLIWNLFLHGDNIESVISKYEILYKEIVQYRSDVNQTHYYAIEELWNIINKR